MSLCNYYTHTSRPSLEIKHDSFPLRAFLGVFFVDFFTFPLSVKRSKKINKTNKRTPANARSRERVPKHTYICYVRLRIF